MSDETNELDELLKDAADEAEASEQKPEGTPEDKPAEAKPAESQEDKGDGKPAEEGKPDEGKPAETPAAETETWTKAAVLDERKKRQALQAELDALKSKQDDKPRPDVFEDQEGAFAHLEGKLDRARLEDRVTLSREFMLALKDDYEEKETLFTELATKDKSLAREMLASPNPARFAYETAVKHLEWQKMQNVDEYKANLEKEVRAKVEAEMKAKIEGEKKREESQSQADVPSLANAGSGGEKTDLSNESLEEILGR